MLPITAFVYLFRHSYLSVWLNDTLEYTIQNTHKQSRDERKKNHLLLCTIWIYPKEKMWMVKKKGRKTMTKVIKIGTKHAVKIKERWKFNGQINNNTFSNLCCFIIFWQLPFNSLSKRKALEKFFMLNFIFTWWSLIRFSPN